MRHFLHSNFFDKKKKKKSDAQYGHMGSSMSHIFRIYELKRISGKFLISRLEIRYHWVLFVLNLSKFWKPHFSICLSQEWLKKQYCFDCSGVRECRAECYLRRNNEWGFGVWLIRSCTDQCFYFRYTKYFIISLFV